MDVGERRVVDAAQVDAGDLGAKPRGGGRETGRGDEEGSVEGSRLAAHGWLPSGVVSFRGGFPPGWLSFRVWADATAKPRAARYRKPGTSPWSNFPDTGMPTRM